MVIDDQRSDRVSLAFQGIEEDRARRADPPFWGQSPRPDRKGRDLVLAILLALLASVIGITWIWR
jgi:hypothetical protein